ncbi:MAG TPA: chemotaxis protein CheW [Nitrospira sp.]|nr:chemotaxis protein CheW [Nitrospira sp.]
MSLRGHHKVTTAVVQTARLLVVRFGKLWCAVPSQGVRGVLTPQEAGSAGRVTFVGMTYDDMDLAGRLGTALDASNSDMRVVLYSNGQTHGAVRVEEVIGMIEVERAECQPLPSHFQQEERTWISGTTIYREQLVLILSPEWILGELGEVVSSPHALSAS